MTNFTTWELSEMRAQVKRAERDTDKSFRDLVEPSAYMRNIYGSRLEDLRELLRKLNEAIKANETGVRVGYYTICDTCDSENECRMTRHCGSEWSAE